MLVILTMPHTAMHDVLGMSRLMNNKSGSGCGALCALSCGALCSVFEKTKDCVQRFEYQGVEVGWVEVVGIVGEVNTDRTSVGL